MSHVLYKSYRLQRQLITELTVIRAIDNSQYCDSIIGIIGISLPVKWKVLTSCLQEPPPTSFFHDQLEPKLK